jgi:hypothetical protein
MDRKYSLHCPDSLLMSEKSGGPQGRAKMDDAKCSIRAGALFGDST